MLCMFYSSLIYDHGLRQEEGKVHGMAKEKDILSTVEKVLLSIIIDICLSCSAYLIARFVKTSTNQEPNSCLVWTHIILLGIEAITVFIWLFFYFRYLILLK